MKSARTFSHLRITQHLVSFSFLCSLLAIAYLIYNTYHLLTVLAAVRSGQIAPEWMNALLLAIPSVQSLGNLVVGSTLVSMLLFFLWLFASYKNLYLLNRSGMRFSPAWAVGWFFVPIFNLFKPYQVIIDLWQNTFRHHPAPPRYVQKGQPLILAWWLTNVASQLLSSAANADAGQVAASTLPLAEMAQQYYTLVQLIMAASVFSLFVVAGFVILVFIITEAQRTTFNDLQNRGQDTTL